MTKDEFERLLELVVQRLKSEAQREKFTASGQFENRVRKLLVELGQDEKVRIDFDPHPHCMSSKQVGLLEPGFRVYLGIR